LTIIESSVKNEVKAEPTRKKFEEKMDLDNFGDIKQIYTFPAK